jgi:hypothetical protein
LKDSHYDELILRQKIEVQGAKAGFLPVIFLLLPPLSLSHPLLHFSQLRAIVRNKTDKVLGTHEMCSVKNSKKQMNRTLLKKE